MADNKPNVFPSAKWRQEPLNVCTLQAVKGERRIFPKNVISLMSEVGESERTSVVRGCSWALQQGISGGLKRLSAQGEEADL